ncbi:MAG: helix-turn-helix domain-containing protein, partial [Eubacterium sp.]|nr:helix-turn-helix domain-containing protein [Eubacterium sp.]
MPNKSIGQFIAALRKANGLTQKELAEKLNVSDKAISRWERDECAPDISLIPVIAEIFSVTCDELLCGERKPAETIKSEDNDTYLSPKAEKQQQRILKSTLAELKNRSCIVIAISVLGLIAAAICNLGFDRAYLGFFIAVSFFVVSMICQLIFANKAFFAVSDVEIGAEEISRFKTTATNITGLMISFIVGLTVFCLPLITLPDDAYLGVVGTSWLAYGALFVVPFIIAVLLVYNFVNMKMAKQSNQMDVYKKFKHNLILKLGSIIVLAVALFITNGVCFVVTDGGNPHKFAGGKIYDKDSFVALMETEDPGNGPFVIEDYADDEDYEENEDEENREFITDDDNNVVCEFVNRNHSVVTYEYEFDSKGELVFKAFTDEDLENGQFNLNLIQTAFAVAYA